MSDEVARRLDDKPETDHPEWDADGEVIDSVERRAGLLADSLEERGEKKYADAWRFAMQVPEGALVSAHVIGGDEYLSTISVDSGRGMRPAHLSGTLLFVVGALEDEQGEGHGVSQDRLLAALGLSRLQEGRLALSMKDARKAGLVRLTVPRTEQYRYALTEEGWRIVGDFQVEIEGEVVEDETPELSA